MTGWALISGATQHGIVWLGKLRKYIQYSSIFLQRNKDAPPGRQSTLGKKRKNDNCVTNRSTRPYDTKAFGRVRSRNGCPSLAYLAWSAFVSFRVPLSFVCLPFSDFFRLFPTFSTFSTTKTGNKSSCKKINQPTCALWSRLSSLLVRLSVVHGTFFRCFLVAAAGCSRLQSPAAAAPVLRQLKRYAIDFQSCYKRHVLLSPFVIPILF